MISYSILFELSSSHPLPFYSSLAIEQETLFSLSEKQCRPFFLIILKGDKVNQKRAVHLIWNMVSHFFLRRRLSWDYLTFPAHSIIGFLILVSISILALFYWLWFSPIDSGSPRSIPCCMNQLLTRLNTKLSISFAESISSIFMVILCSLPET